MLITENIKMQLGNWWPIMSDIIASKEWDSLYAMLKNRVAQKQIVIPKSPDVWKAWSLCDRHKVKCVIIGQDPYPSMKGEIMVANGVPFDCSATNIIQPSLYAIWESVEKYYKKSTIDPDMQYSSDISWWITKENVLLINSCGTTEKDKPGIHWQWWEPVMKMFMEVLNTNYRSLPICLLGNQAQKLEVSINPMINHIYKCEHPVMASRNNRPWQTDMFTWVNNIIESNNGPSEKIVWWRTKDDKIKEEKADRKPWKGSAVWQQNTVPWEDKPKVEDEGNDKLPF